MLQLQIQIARLTSDGDILSVIAKSVCCEMHVAWQTTSDFEHVWSMLDDFIKKVIEVLVVDCIGVSVVLWCVT